jgi:hypothetical protein
MPGTVSTFAGADVEGAVLVDPGSDVDVPAAVVVGAVRSSEPPFPHAIATTAITVAAITRRRSERRSGLRSKRCTVRALGVQEVSDCPAMEGNRRGHVRGRMLATVGAVLGAALAVSPGSWAATDATDDAETEQSWAQVTGDDSRNTDEVAVVRTADGVLHVLWYQRASGNQELIQHTPITDGEVGETTTASGPWRSAGDPAAVLTPEGGIRVFFPGLTGSDATADGVQSASTDAKATTWTQTGQVSSTRSAVPDGVGAGVRPDDVPAFAYAYSFVLGLHFGLDPGTPDVNLLSSRACCAYFPNLAFSETDDDGYIGWYSNVTDQEGLWVQQIWPTMGTPTAVPEATVDGKLLAPSQRSPIAARVGGGTYYAYCSGYPTCTEVKLWKVGDPAPVDVATGKDVEEVNLAADPDGRLWVMWEDTAEGLFATRTNEDADEFGAVVQVDRAPDADTTWKLQGNATEDQLDVFAAFTTPDAIATWHTAVLPGLTVETAKTKKKVTFSVSDAGEPVAGAKVAFKKKTVTTNAKGQASAPSAKGTATITKTGYTDAVATVK